MVMIPKLGLLKLYNHVIAKAIFLFLRLIFDSLI